MNYSRRFSRFSKGLRRKQSRNFSYKAVFVLQSHLTNRKQFVRLSNADSEMENIEIGVPQGSVLGPLLFIVYINDLLNSAPNLSYVLFADDTNVFSTNSHQMKYQISLINNCCTSDRLVINYDKTHQILFKALNNYGLLSFTK